GNGVVEGVGDDRGERAGQAGRVEQLVRDELDAGGRRADRDGAATQLCHRPDVGVGADHDVQVVVVDPGERGQPGVGLVPGFGHVGGDEGDVGLAGQHLVDVV